MKRLEKIYLIVTILYNGIFKITISWGLNKACLLFMYSHNVCSMNFGNPYYHNAYCIIIIISILDSEWSEEAIGILRQYFALTNVYIYI